MLSTSNLSAHQAAHYYSKEDYYSQEEGVSPSRWLGEGTKKLNLSGDVNTETFQQLLRGQTPKGQNLFSRKVNIDKRRAATDFTFSAPKSVSIAALVQQDERVVKAHHQAVAKAISVLEERYAQTRISTETGRQRIKTGNLITAVFTHGTSREVEPQLHSHCVVLNATLLPDGRWFSFTNEQAIANKKLLGQLYQNELAHLLKQQGYDIEPKAHGQFELKGYDPELLKAFSTRRKQILSLLEEWESEGKKPTDSNGKEIQSEMLLREAANLKTRKNKPKVTSAERLLKGWKAFVQLKGYELPELPEFLGEGGAIAPSKTANAKSNLKPAIQHCGERDAVFRQTHLERFVFEHHLGEQSWEELEGAIAQALTGQFATNPQLIKVEEQKFTTQAAINLELNTIRLMQQGRGKVEPLAFPESLVSDSTLTQEQQQAIQFTCTTPDQFIAWQGSAGSGKTYALNTLKQIAQSQGYQVRGFAPSAEAAHGLGQALDIQTETVAALLTSQNRETGNAVWIVDEAGLLSMKDARALLTRATAEQTRVILVGDTKQLSAVEAGNPFKSLQAGGITTAYLDETLRQQRQELKAAVQLIAQGKMFQGIDTLDAAECIREVENADLRRKHLAQDYLALSSEEREQTLILAGTNQERLALTQTLRAELQAEGCLSQDSFTVMGLRQKNITKAQAAYVTVYQPGDVLVPTQNYKKQGLLKGQQYTVISIDRENHRLLVETPNGHVMGIDPGRCPLKSVYVGQEFQVAPGDQLRWTKNDRANNRRNGQRFTIQQIAPDGIAQILDTEGNTQQINLSGRQYLDYAWVSTTYGSQGKTADRVMALMDRTTTNRESFYVTISRAKYHLALYTADKVALSQWADVSKAKENTSDYVPLVQVVEKKVASPPENPQSISPIVKQPIATTITKESLGQVQSVIPHESPHPNIDRHKTEFPLPKSNAQPSAKQKYMALWQRFSQGLTAGDLVNLDIQVTQRALKDGQPQKDIALMLSAGSPMVRRLIQDQGKQPAMLYVNQTVRKILSPRTTQKPQYEMTQQKPNQLRTQAPLPESDTQPSAKQKYLALWQQYSQRITVSDPVNLDLQVAQRALRDGQFQKEIALMLSAGSPMVQRIIQDQGKQPAMLYVNQTIRKILSRQTAQKTQQHKLRRGRQMELE